MTGLKLTRFKKLKHYYYVTAALSCVAVAIWTHKLAENQAMQSRVIVGQTGEILWRLSQSREKMIVAQYEAQRIIDGQSAEGAQRRYAQNLQFLSLNLKDLVALEYSPTILAPAQLKKYKSILDRINALRSQSLSPDNRVPFNELTAIRSILMDLTSNSTNLSHLTSAISAQNGKVITLRLISLLFIAMIIAMGIWYSWRHVTMKGIIRQGGDHTNLLFHQATKISGQITSNLSASPPELAAAKQSAKELDDMLRWFRQIPIGQNNTSIKDQELWPLGIILTIAGRIREDIRPVINWTNEAYIALVPSLHFTVMLEDIVSDAVRRITGQPNACLVITAAVKTSLSYRKTVYITIEDNGPEEPGRTETESCDGTNLTRYLIEDIAGEVRSVQAARSRKTTISYHLARPSK